MEKHEINSVWNETSRICVRLKEEKMLNEICLWKVAYCTPKFSPGVSRHYSMLSIMDTLFSLQSFPCDRIINLSRFVVPVAFNNILRQVSLTNLFATTERSYEEKTRNETSTARSVIYNLFFLPRVHIGVL